MKAGNQRFEINGSYYIKINKVAADRAGTHTFYLLETRLIMILREFGHVFMGGGI